MVRREFLPGFAGQLLAAASQFAIAVTAVFFALYKPTGYALLYVAEYVFMALFYLLFAVTARRIIASFNMALVAILGSTLALIGTTVNLVLNVAISPVGHWLPIYDQLAWILFVVNSILIGIAQLGIGTFFIKCAKEWSFPHFWKIAGIFYILGGAFESTLLWGANMFLLAAWLMGAACFGAEKADK